jgi:hypothetical protein
MIVFHHSHHPFQQFLCLLDCKNIKAKLINPSARTAIRERERERE